MDILRENKRIGRATLSTVLIISMITLSLFSASFFIPRTEIAVGAVTPQNGRVDFVTDHDPDIYWVLDATDLGTNYGDSVAGNDDNTAVIAGDIGTSDGYSGMSNRNDDGQNSDFDIHLTNDSAMLIYVPAGMTHSTSYGLWHNGGGTNAQGAFLRPTATGVELVCNHNNANGSADQAVYEIPDAELPDWFAFSCQFNSHGGVEGDMAIWVDGVAECSGTRTFTLDYGSGDPDFGFNNGNDPDAADAVCSYSGTDHGATTAITSSGILIANFAADNPSGGASDTSAGNGNAWHEDYYTDHHDAGSPPAESTPTQDTYWFGKLEDDVELA